MKKYKDIALGIVLGATLVSAIPVAYATYKKSIEVQTGITIYVDNVKLTPTDINGNEVEVFIYEGTTYLPVRAITTALGEDIHWVESTTSVYIGEEPKTERVPIYIDGIDITEPLTEGITPENAVRSPVINEPQVEISVVPEFTEDITGGIEHPEGVTVAYSDIVSWVYYLAEGDMDNYSNWDSILADSSRGQIDEYGQTPLDRYNLFKADPFGASDELVSCYQRLSITGDRGIKPYGAIYGELNSLIANWILVGDNYVNPNAS